MGTYGSRSLAVGGTAIAKACDKIVEKGKAVAANMLKLRQMKLNLKMVKFIVPNTNKKKTIGEIAFACYLPGTYGEIKSPPEGMEPGLKETAFYDPVNFFQQVHIFVKLKLTPTTGETKVDTYTCVDDFGNLINP